MCDGERAREITFARSRFFSLRIASSQKRSLVSVQSVDLCVCVFVACTQSLIQNEWDVCMTLCGERKKNRTSKRSVRIVRIARFRRERRR